MIKGFTKIPNTVLEKIVMSNFSKRQLKILLYLCRLQFGFHRAKANVKKSDFRLCGLRRNAIRSELDKLRNLGIIENSDLVDLVCLNLDVDFWKIEQITNIDSELIPKLRNDVFSKQFKQIPDMGNIIRERLNELGGNFSLKKSKDIKDNDFSDLITN